MKRFLSVLVVIGCCGAVALMGYLSGESISQRVTEPSLQAVDTGVSARKVDAPVERPTPGRAKTAFLKIRVLEARDEGSLRVAVFHHRGAFPDRDQALHRYALTSKRELTIRELPPGVYAVAVFQDINGDGKLNRNLFGRPTEPYGFSKNARGRFGPPEFEQASFALSKRGHQIEIRLR